MVENLLHLDARIALCDRLRHMYGQGWASGTGGGICARVGDDVVLAPSGVHKERVKPEDFFVKKLGGEYVSRPSGLKVSQCTSIFEAIMRLRGAGAVAHSHGIYPVWAADMSMTDSLNISGLEMLKGVRNCRNDEEHLVPIISNAPEEEQLTDTVSTVLSDERFAKAFCVLVRDHGAYIWGKDIDEAKRHLEIYHFLFEAIWGRTIARELSASRRSRA